MVTEQAFGSAAATDVILESVRDLLLSFHGMDIADAGGGAAVELGHGSAIVNGGDVRKDGIGGDIFITSGDIESRVRRAEPLAEDVTHRNTGHLSGGLEGTFDNIDRLPEEMRSEGSIVGVALVDVTGVDVVLKDVDILENRNGGKVGIGEAAGDVEVVFVNRVAMAVVTALVKTVIGQRPVVVSLMKSLRVMFIIKGGGIPLIGRGHDDVWEIMPVVITACTSLEVGKSVDDIDGHDVTVVCGKSL